MTEQATLKPIKPFLKIPAGSEPYIEGLRCESCQAVFFETHLACPKCTTHDSLKPSKLSNTGKLHVYSIVHRSMPGIPVPYVSAIVDLDGGGTLKSNLINVDPDPKKIEFGMAVEIVFNVAAQKDKEGNEYLAYQFQPRS